MDDAPHRAGFAAIVGEPNAGKSTLLNAIVGEKVAIVTEKPQTTRNRITGVKTLPGAQVVFVDTPGVRVEPQPLSRALARTAIGALDAADTVLFVIAVSPGPMRPLTRHEEAVMAAVKRAAKPALLLLNKVDRLAQKSDLLPLIAQMGEGALFSAVIPISALKQDGLDRVVTETVALLPEGPRLFDGDALTDRPERFLVAELVREELIRATTEELPYSIAVVTEEFVEAADADGLVRIACVIFVERESQKGVVIGKGGRMLKAVGTAARAQIERLLAHRVFLRLTVKVRSDWRRDPRALRELGVGDDHD